MKLSVEVLEEFAKHLRREERSAATQEKYLRDVRAFCAYAGDAELTKELVAGWKKQLAACGYAVRSVNSMLAGVNGLLEFLDLPAYKVKNIRTQRQTYCAEDGELTRAEYLRLLAAAEGNERLRLVLQTICATGIRVSELQYFTVEAVRRDRVHVDCKNKIRTVLVPEKLRERLLKYAERRGITDGAIFVTQSGKPLNRSNIWLSMKRLCEAADVCPGKVFPHNLRKLFARTFYGAEKDIAELADLLGHSSINTTRIYIMTSGAEHRRKIERLDLLP